MPGPRARRERVVTPKRVAVALAALAVLFVALRFALTSAPPLANTLQASHRIPRHSLLRPGDKWPGYDGEASLSQHGPIGGSQSEANPNTEPTTTINQFTVDSADQGTAHAQPSPKSGSPASTNASHVSAQQQAQPRVAQDDAAAAQAQLLSADIIHSDVPFQPQQHLPFYPSQACTCPPKADAAANDFATLISHSREQSQPLATPTRVHLPPDAQPLPGAEVFAEVYVANLPSRADRQHYMCEVLSHLRIPAILWPAYPKDHSVVRAYTSQSRHATYTPGAAYDVLKPQPPQPPAAPPPLPSAVAPDASLRAAMAARRAARRAMPRQHLRTSQAACYLSHREIWHDMARRRLEGPMLVLEDDVDVEEDFVGIMHNALRALPRDWAVLWVGSCFEEMRNHTQQVGHRCAPVASRCAGATRTSASPEAEQLCMQALGVAVPHVHARLRLSRPPRGGGDAAGAGPRRREPCRPGDGTRARAAPRRAALLRHAAATHRTAVPHRQAPGAPWAACLGTAREAPVRIPESLLRSALACPRCAVSA